MARVTVLPHEEYCPQGTTIEVPAGTTICQALLDNGIEIEHGRPCGSHGFHGPTGRHGRRGPP